MVLRLAGRVIEEGRVKYLRRVPDFEKWMVFEDNALLWEALMFFAHNGKCILNVNWKEE